MEINTTANQLNAAIGPKTPIPKAEVEQLNAFGIGEANRPNVELSPQAQILQRNEQIQNQRQAQLDRQTERNQQNDNTQNQPNDGFVRLRR
jgi:hypothetical protein